MSSDYILLSTLNDFIFCPYSIYLHNIYMEGDEGLYHATPQLQGRIAHEAVDTKRSSTKKSDILALPVYSNRLGIMGKIDVYKGKEHHLIERKYQLKHIFRGHLYQLWGQYYCLTDMGYPVDKLSFYEISTNKSIPVDLPTPQDFDELTAIIQQFKHYNPASPIETNPNKCSHCIYNPLCDKTSIDNVY